MFLGCNHLVLSLRWRPALSSLSSHRHMFWCLPLWFNCCRLLCLFWGCRWQPAPLFYELWYFFHVLLIFICFCLLCLFLSLTFRNHVPLRHTDPLLTSCCRIHPKTLANPFLDVITSIFFVFNLWDECSFLRRFDARNVLDAFELFQYSLNLFLSPWLFPLMHFLIFLLTSCTCSLSSFLMFLLSLTSARISSSSSPILSFLFFDLSMSPLFVVFFAAATSLFFQKYFL